MLPEVGCALRDFAFAIIYVYADLCHCPWLVPFKFHVEHNNQHRLKTYCGVLLFSFVRYNRYLTREAATVVKLKSRIWGCRVARMGKNLLSSTPICALLGICDLCMLLYYFPSVTALSLYLDAKNVHLSPSLLAFYASLYPLDVLLCFSLFREVFAFDFIWSVYNLTLRCAEWLEWNCSYISNIATQPVMSGIRTG
jgi:hypothetical protein